jgi:tol-pal system protein YbgF
LGAKLVGAFLLSLAWLTEPSLAASPNLPDTSRHLYDRVMEEFKQGDYEAARAGFHLLVELHPHSALASNAHYWMGECYYRLGRYQDALTSFSQVGSYAPASSKLAASMFKIGLTYTRLGDYAKASGMFNRVVNEYPDGAEAALAQKALDGMIPRSQLTSLDHRQR